MTIALLIGACGFVTFGLIVWVRWIEAENWRRSLVSYEVRLPSNLKPDDVAAWLSGIAALTHARRGFVQPAPPAVFEVHASSDGIKHYLFVPESLQIPVLASVRATMPGARLEAAKFPNDRSRHPVAAQLRLTGRDRQMAVDRAAVASQLQLAAIQPLAQGEHIRWQWILAGAVTPPMVRSAGHNRPLHLGFTDDGGLAVDSEAIRAARLKRSQPLLHASGRLLVEAKTRRAAYAIFGRAWGPARTLNVPGAELVRSWLPSSLVASRVQNLRLPLLAWPLYLNCKELAGLIGMPFGEGALPGLAQSVARQLPPVRQSSGGTVVADSNYPGSTQPITLQRRDRLMHLWVGGPTGVGKSTLLANLALQDIAYGDGLALIDPKGDLVEEILARVPADRQGDVVVFDPSDTNQPVGFNVLASRGGEQARELAVDNLLHILRGLWSAYWGPRTEAVLHAALLTLTATTTNTGQAYTLCEVSTLLTNQKFRQRVLDHEQVPASVRSFWRWYHSLSEGERTQVIGPVLNKLSAFTSRTALRLTLGQSTGIDLSQAMQERKILLMPLSSGKLGAETASLLGSLMVASIWQAALGRVNLDQAARRPWWLYIDEAQEVVRLPIAVADMLAMARGLGVGVTFSNQHLAQLPENVQQAMHSTVRSQVVFQLQRRDAKVLAGTFAPSLDESDLTGLAAHEVALRLAVDGQTVRPMTGITRPLPEVDPSKDLQLRIASRRHYGQPRQTIEAELQARIEARETNAPFGQRLKESN